VLLGAERRVYATTRRLGSASPPQRGWLGRASGLRRSARLSEGLVYYSVDVFLSLILLLLLPLSLSMVAPAIASKFDRASACRHAQLLLQPTFEAHLRL
jgi:hypothetical protein